MTALDDAVQAFQDPIAVLCEEAIRRVHHRKMHLLRDYVMGHLPKDGVPRPYWPYLAHGIVHELRRQLRREIKIGDERQRVWVVVNGEWRQFVALTLPMYRSYIDGLKESVARDRSRIKFHERQYNQAEQRADGDETAAIGELLDLGDAA